MPQWAVDATQEGMVQMLFGFQTTMLLTVHDEIVFDMHRHEQSAVMPIIEECMKRRCRCEFR